LYASPPDTTMSSSSGRDAMYAKALLPALLRRLEADLLDLVGVVPTA
jgi:hypothetical protein